MLEKLKAKGYLVLDGAMGSNLFLLGLISGDSPEAWNLEHPDRVKKVHQAFVQAGSDIILTNTFGGNRHRLKLHQLENQVVEVNRAAVKLARECAGDSVMVAGSMGPHRRDHRTSREPVGERCRRRFPRAGHWTR